jgi:hypothetical protein
LDEDVWAEISTTLSRLLFFSAIYFAFLRPLFSAVCAKPFAKPAFFITPMTNRCSGKQKYGCTVGSFRPMGGSLAAALASLDVGTLFFVAICVTVLLGLFLLHAWLQEGNRALAWWSLAYLIGGASGALWRFGDGVAPIVPSGTSTVLLPLRSVWPGAGRAPFTAGRFAGPSWRSAPGSGSSRHFFRPLRSRPLPAS